MTIRNSFGKAIYGSTILPAGKKLVTIAGTRVQLSALGSLCSGVYIKALAANVGKIYVGDITVSATAGYELSAGQEISK